MARSNVRHRRSHAAASSPQAESAPGTSGDHAEVRDLRHDSSRNDFDISGVMIQGHPVWPDIPTGQGDVFFECTLFLYSILALFLQYLNLYKTLWWLPKSYWHYSMKLHLINPYLLSCVGLLLGCRVTRCFWNRISYVFGKIILDERPRWFNITAVIIEFGVIKTPLFVLVITSFFFSFSRVYFDFPSKTFLYFGYVIFAFCLAFAHDAAFKLSAALEFFRLNFGHSDFLHKMELCLASFGKESQMVDMELVTHMCSTSPSLIREEVDILCNDFFHRVKHCIFVGISSAYFSIFIPCVFTPEKTLNGLPQEMLVDYVWVAQLAIIVACTSFSLYVTYLFPLNYCDLLHRSSIHLGYWQQIEDPKGAPKIRDWQFDKLYQSGDVCCVKGKFYRAVAARNQGIAADPTSNNHKFFFGFSSDCTKIPTLLCCFQLGLIVFQFWLLVLTTDWQHIVTLVLLMFANYLLLAKVFKDRVVINRIYRPSPEDLQLIDQLKAGA
ncbi:hypothetical protein L596_008338 [Steinernema carpocapsae]|uniref:Transmembrane protein 39A n=1 Tax=Steinernema carpocapsae TaxID=34508 RepID=A0A4U5PCF2_STECR|nr:hypothetical protein L596_008338 [Steinernema carpocapsae]